MSRIICQTAPIVKWLSQPSYERLFWVQFPVGATHPFYKYNMKN